MSRLGDPLGSSSKKQRDQAWQQFIQPPSEHGTGSTPTGMTPQSPYVSGANPGAARDDRLKRLWKWFGATVLGIVVAGVSALAVDWVKHFGDPPQPVPTGSPGPSTVISYSSPPTSTAVAPSTSSASPSPSSESTTSSSSDPTATGTPGSIMPSTSMTSSPAPPPPTPTKVSLGELCNTPGAYAVFCGPGYGGTADIGDHVFTYHGSLNPATPPQWSDLLRFPASKCSKLVISFGADYGGPLTINARVIQAGSPPVSAKAGYGQVGTLTASLNGGPFSLQFNDSNGTAVFLDGYAVCLPSS